MNAESNDGIATFEKQIAEAALNEEVFPALTPEETRIKGRLISEPPPPEVVIIHKDAPLLTRGCVGAVVAAGGTGKTYLMIQLAYMMSSGSNIGPFRAPKPLKVLLLVAEDPQDELDRRLWRVCNGKFPNGLHAMSVSGKIGPIMNLANGNPERSAWFEWLNKTIKNHGDLDVLIIDPKSRLYGLDENNNDHNTQWIGALEALAIEHKLTILFAHHVSKTMSEKLHQNMSRGGSALADGVRWLAGLTPMDSNTAKKYKINERNYVELDLLKANYVPKIPDTIFFRRESNGVLQYLNLQITHIQKMTIKLVQILAEKGARFTRRELVKDMVARHISETMAMEFEKFTRSKDMPTCIDFGLREGWLEEVIEGTPKNPKTIIRVKNSEQLL